jgi:predicted hydrocarbon binding protein
MNKIPDSGYYNTNRFARIFLEAAREITGENGLKTLLNFSDLSRYVSEPPPDNLEKEFDFASFSMINNALVDIYGTRGGKGLALRIGRTTFADVLKDYGDIAGIGDVEFKVLPLQEKIKFGLEAMARVFSEKSDQITSIDEIEDAFLYRIERCPVCWGRKSEEGPICYYMVGLLKEGLHWVSGGKEFTITETRCIGQGDEVCEFAIQKEPFEG